MFSLKKSFLGACLVLSASLFLSHCSSSPATEKTERIASETDTLQLAAKRFDLFLTNGQSESELAAYKLECQKDVSPFCFSVREKARLEKIFRQANPRRPGKPPNTITRIKMVKKKIANWPDLRFASVQSIIKGLNLLSLNGLEAVRTYAMKEKRCPNNAALAVASQLEDFLPEKLSYVELARVYEKAAQCPIDGKEMQEMLWTRSGLFYLAGKRPDLALRVFHRASIMTGAYRARSLYWLYKTKLEMGDFTNAQATLKELKETYPFSFHTLIALTNRNEDPGKILDREDVSEKKRSESSTDVNRLLEQVEILQKYEFQASASRVLDWAMALAQQESEPELLIYISDLKEEQGDHVSRISLLSEILYQNPKLISRSIMERYFPKPYFPIFQSNSEGIDPYLLLAIARRESAFNPKAVSSADARGLLQVTPRSAREVGSNEELFEPSSNVKAGARLFGDLLRRLNGQIHLALAAYNAGPKRISTWTSRYPSEDPILFIDLIPFRETREYVAAVLRNYYWYQKLNRGEHSISARGMLEYQGSEGVSTPQGPSPISPFQHVPQ